MMKKSISILLALAACLCLVVFAAADSRGAYVWDEADLLSVYEEEALASVLRQVSDAYDVQVAVCTVSVTPGGNADAYIEAFYDQKEIGRGTDRAGILLMLCMDIQQLRILSNGAAADALTPGRIDRIGDAIASDLSDGKYYDAFCEFADQCQYYLDGHVNGFPFPWVRNLIIALIIGLAVGLIVAFSLKAQLKSVRMQTRAHDYVKENSMCLTGRSDLYLYRTLRRTRRESNNASRSGSSRSRNVGGRSF